MEAQRRIHGELAEVRPVVLLDLERREELGVKVPRGEAEGLAVVLTDDAGNVGRSDLADGASHPLGAVVVGGDCQRPAVERTMDLAQVESGGPRRGERVPALVDERVDAHEAPAGRRNELPDAGRPGFRVGAQVERRLDEREAGQLDRQPLVREDALHLRQVTPRDLYGLGKPFAEAPLTVEPLGIGGGEEAVAGRIIREEVDDPLRLGMRAQGVQAQQGRSHPLELEVGVETHQALELPLAHPLVEVVAEVEHLVDLVDMNRVVQNNLVPGVVREDGAPEADLRGHLRRLGEEHGTVQRPVGGVVRSRPGDQDQISKNRS